MIPAKANVCSQGGRRTAKREDTWKAGCKVHGVPSNQDLKGFYKLCLYIVCRCASGGQRTTLRGQLLPFDPYISSNSSPGLLQKCIYSAISTSQRGVLISKDQSVFWKYYIH